MAERDVRRMTVEEFLAWEPEDGERYELVDGLPRAMTGARMKHDRVVRRTMRALEDRLGDGPCEPFGELIAVRTPRGNVLRPDITVDCGRRPDEATMAEVPVMIVEVLSRSTESYDLLIKILEYKSIPTVRHVLFVKPEGYRVVLHSRTEEGAWTERSLIGRDTVVELPALRLSIPIADLYPPRS